MNVERDTEQTGAATPEADRIVAEVLAGDTPAFGGLVRFYQESVWRIAAVLLRDRDATENLVQQVFVDAYFHLDQYAPGTDFGAWIRTVARNRLRKELRNAVREDRRLAVYRERLAERLRADKAAGKPTGILAPKEEDARRYIAMGATFVGVGSDLGVFRAGTQALRDKYLNS